MLDPTALFAWEDHVDQRTVSAPTMVVTLGSYVDAGPGNDRVTGSYYADAKSQRDRTISLNLKQGQTVEVSSTSGVRPGLAR